MLQARYHRRGPVPQDVIAAEPLSLPDPGAGQVLVEVLAAPINPSDVLTLTGDYGSLPPLPAVGGNEGVGRVAAVGEGARLAIGQRVLLPVGGGTWATHQLADARALVPLPDTGDAVQLSMLAVNPPTAALLLRGFVDLAPGDWVLQNAANSAVGGYLVQLARAAGLHTVNVVRRADAVPAVRETGGDVVLVDGDDLAARVQQATGGARPRLGVDAVGGPASGRLAEALAPGGTLVNYGAMSGEPCAVSAGALVFRGITLRGFWLARWFKTATVDARTGLFGELAARVADGTLHARVQATYPVSAIREAVAAATQGERDGKIVLVPDARDRA